MFFFNDTATTEIYTLSLHDALPIYRLTGLTDDGDRVRVLFANGSSTEVDLLVGADGIHSVVRGLRSEEHTSELQSRQYLVCRLLLEKKKKQSSLPHFSYSH